MVDLLGKCDRHVATLPARAPIHPGHDKWDYEYSIGKLRPDVVFQLARVTDEERRRIAGWGYVTRCEPLLGEALFLAGSPNVRWNRLSECPPRPATTPPAPPGAPPPPPVSPSSRPR